MEEVKVLYRYEMRNYNEVFTPEIELHEYQVTKETNCGYWIHKYKQYGPKKFVLKNEHSSGKRFAYVTKAAALDAFIYRRRFYQRMLESRAIGNEKVIELALELKNTKAEKPVNF
jgi:hypothetical protein